MSVLVLVAAGASVACLQNRAVDNQPTQGRILLWHALEGRDAQVLDQMLNQYLDLHPGVTLVQEQLPTDEMVTLYGRQVQAGLGPDLMLTQDFDLPSLLDQDLIQEIEPGDFDVSDLASAPLDEVSFQGGLAGVPFSVYSQVLCYNTSLLARPPTTLAEVERDAEAGIHLGLNSNFADLWWGLPLFDSQLLDNDGQLILDKVGFTEWVGWLQKADENNNITLSSDTVQLEQSFLEENLAAMTCWSDRLPVLQAELGQDKVGVGILPGTLERLADALIVTNVFVFNPAADPDKLGLAHHLARFLTNEVQQTYLAREAGSQIPVNKNIAVDRRLAPLAATLIAQSKRSFVLDHIDGVAVAAEIGQPIFQAVLAGERDPGFAAGDINRLVNESLERGNE